MGFMNFGPRWRLFMRCLFSCSLELLPSGRKILLALFDGHVIAAFDGLLPRPRGAYQLSEISLAHCGLNRRCVCGHRVEPATKILTLQPHNFRNLSVHLLWAVHDHSFGRASSIPLHGWNTYSTWLL